MYLVYFCGIYFRSTVRWWLTLAVFHSPKREPVKMTHPFSTLSPTTMVHWKMISVEKKLILKGPIFPLNHDCGRKSIGWHFHENNLLKYLPSVAGAWGFLRWVPFKKTSPTSTRKGTPRFALMNLCCSWVVVERKVPEEKRGTTFWNQQRFKWKGKRIWTKPSWFAAAILIFGGCKGRGRITLYCKDLKIHESQQLARV